MIPTGFLVVRSFRFEILVVASFTNWRLFWLSADCGWLAPADSIDWKGKFPPPFILSNVSSCNVICVLALQLVTTHQLFLYCWPMICTVQLPNLQLGGHLMYKSIVIGPITWDHHWHAAACVGNLLEVLPYLHKHPVLTGSFLLTDLWVWDSPSQDHVFCSINHTNWLPRNYWNVDHLFQALQKFQTKGLWSVFKVMIPIVFHSEVFCLCSVSAENWEDCFLLAASWNSHLRGSEWPCVLRIFWDQFEMLPQTK